MTETLSSINHNWALLHRDIITPVVFVKVSEHAGTAKYCDEISEASFTCFLQLITVPLH